MKTSAYRLPAAFLALCQEELIRSSLTSLPRKLDFGKQRGLTLDQVHQWMLDTRKNFEVAVAAAVPADQV